MTGLGEKDNTCKKTTRRRVDKDEKREGGEGRIVKQCAGRKEAVREKVRGTERKTLIS